MGVAVNVTALAFDAQQAYLFIAIETSLPILLLLFLRLEAQLFHRLDHLLFGHAHGSRGFCWGLGDTFFLFVRCCLSTWEGLYL